LIKKKPKRRLLEEKIEALSEAFGTYYRNNDRTYARDQFKNLADLTRAHFEKLKKKENLLKLTLLQCFQNSNKGV